MFTKLLVPLAVLLLYAVAVIVVALLAWDYVEHGAGLNPALAVIVASLLGFSCRLVMAEVAR